MHPLFQLPKNAEKQYNVVIIRKHPDSEGFQFFNTMGSAIE